MATHAEQMVEKYEALLLANAGVQTVTVDGVTVSYADLEQRHRYWRKQVAREKGRRPTAASIKLSSGF